MAELTWKGKHIPYNLSQNMKQSTSHQLQTQGCYPSKESEEQSSIFSSATAGWCNRLILGDKSDILSSLLNEFASSVNLIYIDPPFMTGRIFTSGTQVAYRDTWDSGIDGYLQWLYETFMLLHTLLAQNGSLYVHLDWRATHYAKVILDEVFRQGSQDSDAGFKNEIIWHYQSGGRSQKGYARKHDTLLLYTKSSRYCFHGERVGERRGTQKRNNMRKEVGADGRISWTIRSAGHLYSYDEDTLITPSDVWSDIHHLHQKDPERTGYATQKPAALLERIITASSEENDLILDCFCGSGVTPVVAERLGRRWIACDKSELAISTTCGRLLAREHARPFVLQHIVK